MDIPDYKNIEFKSPEGQRGLHVTTEYYETYTTNPYPSDGLVQRQTSTYTELLSMGKPVESVNVTPLLNRSQVMDDAKNNDDIKIKYEYSQYSLPPKGPSVKPIFIPREDTLNFEKIANRTDDLLKSVERTLARSQEVSTRIQRNSIVSVKSGHQSPSTESYTQQLPASYDADRTSEYQKRNSSSGYINPNVQSIIDRYRQSGIIQSSPLRQREGENYRLGLNNSSLLAKERQENVPSPGFQDPPLPQNVINWEARASSEEATKQTGNIANENPEAKRVEDYRSPIANGYYSKDSYGTSYQPGSNKGSITSLDRDYYSGQNYTNVYPTTSQFRNQATSPGYVGTTYTSSYLQKTSIAPVETGIVSTGIKPTTATGMNSSYLYGQTQTGQEPSMLGERIRDFKQPDPSNDDVSKRVVSVIDDMINKYLPENRSLSSSFSQTGKSPMKGRGSVNPEEMRNSEQGAPYLTNYQEREYQSRVEPVGGEGYLSSPQYNGQNSSPESKDQNTGDNRLDQYLRTLSQHAAAGAGSGYKVDESHYTSTQTGNFGIIQPRNFEEEQFEIVEPREEHIQETNITQVFQTPFVVEKDNIRKAEGSQEEQTHERPQEMEIHERGDYHQNNYYEGGEEPKQGYILGDEKELEVAQNEVFSNTELSSDKKLKKITFKVKSSEDNYEERERARETENAHDIPAHILNENTPMSDFNQNQNDQILQANLDENPDSSVFDFDKENFKLEERETVVNNVLQEERPKESRLPPHRSKIKDIQKTIWITPPVQRVVTSNYFMDLEEYKTKAPLLTYVFDKFRSLDLNFSTERREQEGTEGQFA